MAEGTRVLKAEGTVYTKPPGREDFLDSREETAKSLQSCQTLCNPMDCSLPASSIHGILKARILEWVAMPSSRASSQTRD